jgi:hypothetical protein
VQLPNPPAILLSDEDRLMKEWALRYNKVREYLLEKNFDRYCETLAGFNLSDDGWIWADEGSGVDPAIHCIQSYLKRFKISGGIYMSWAWWCSKPRINEAGGGAVVITQDDCLYVTSDDVRKTASDAGVEILN